MYKENDLSQNGGQFANPQAGTLVFYDPRQKMPKISVKERGRFFSQHAGALVYHDSRHKVYKVPMEGGHIFETGAGETTGRFVSRPTFNHTVSFRRSFGDRA